LLCGRFFNEKNLNDHKAVCWNLMCWSAACTFNPNWDQKGWKELVESLEKADEIAGKLKEKVFDGGKEEEEIKQAAATWEALLDEEGAEDGSDEGKEDRGKGGKRARSTRKAPLAPVDLGGKKVKKN